MSGPMHVIVDQFPGGSIAFWEATGTWFGGAMTLAAVLLALLANYIIAIVRRPKLVISYDDASPANRRFLPPAQGSAPTDRRREEVWIRLKVENKSKHPCNNVEVRFLTSQTFGQLYKENRPSWWFKISNLNGVQINIPSKFPQYFDIAYMTHDIESGDVDAFLALTQPDLDNWGATKAKIEAEKSYTQLDAGATHMIYFAVLSDNTRARFYSMKIHVSRLTVTRGEALPVESLLTSFCADSPRSISAEEAFSERRTQTLT